MQRKHLADALAAKYQALVNERDQSLLEADISDDNTALNSLAQICFLQRMVPRWGMRRFTSKAGGAIEQGSANEDLVIKALRGSVKALSKGAYDMEKVREFGLISNLKHRVCATSPDGVFPLLKKNSQEGMGMDLVGLCGLEIKTRGSENTTDALITSVLNGGSWGECLTGTEEFQDYIPDPAYRSQVCQHATALGLDYVMISYLFYLLTQSLTS